MELVFIGACVNKSRLLLYVRRIVTETRQNGFLGLHFTANKVRTFRNYQFCIYFNLVYIGQVMSRMLKYMSNSYIEIDDGRSNIYIFIVL